MTQLAEAFGFNNLFEETVVAIGEPVNDEADLEQTDDRFYELTN